MPYVVAELYGQPVQDNPRKDVVRRAHCPFMEQTCDGGKNRDMMRISADDEALGTLFDDSVARATGGFFPCGVCSVKPDGKPRKWAVCSRRLFAFGTDGVSQRHARIASRIFSLAGFQPGDQVNVWSEITLKEENEQKKSFNYRLDYVLRGDKPDSAPIVLEVMTCSTSGGNRRLNTDMKSAFRSAVYTTLGLREGPALSPSVNIRQVWARMASQMIAKCASAGRAYAP